MILYKVAFPQAGFPFIVSSVTSSVPLGPGWSTYAALPQALKDDHVEMDRAQRQAAADRGVK